jgi:hypothetical protein
MRRQLLEPLGTEPVTGVVHRLGAIPADKGAELAVRLRRRTSRKGEVARALAEGRIVKTFAFRGATHLMTPQDAAVYLALRAAGRMWELPSWQSHYGLTPQDWPAFRKAVREALADGPLTRAALGEVVTARRRYRHLGFAFTDKSWTLLKALAWQGDLSLGEGGVFQRLDLEPLDVDEAGRRAVEAYFRSYGPATPDHVQYWLGAGLGAGRRRIQSWIDGLGGRLAPIDLDGERVFGLREDAAALAATSPSHAVRLLPGYDQWVLGPGTADTRVVPAARRALVSKGANPVIAGGVVSGTWSAKAGRITVDWFPEAGPVPHEALEQEKARIVSLS